MQKNLPKLTENNGFKQIKVCCEACHTCTPFSPLLAQVSNISFSKEKNAAQHQIFGKLNSSLSSQKFQDYLSFLSKRDPIPFHLKNKKIKKRGRKKWTTRHDLILEGCLLLWGDDIRIIGKLLPEFNQNVITKKLSHLMWKKYAVNSDLQNRAFDFSKTFGSQKISFPEFPMALNSNLFVFSNEELENFEKSSELKNRKVKVILNDKKPNESQCFFNFELDLKDYSPMNSHSPVFPLYVESIADLSKALEDNSKIFKDVSNLLTNRKDQQYYQNSLINVFSIEKLE